MRRQRRWLAAGALLAVTWPPPLAAHTPAASPSSALSYDAFMTSEPSPRGQAFSRLSPENKSQIMKTHMRRWQAAHRTALSAEQNTAIDENVATLQPGFYQQPTTRQWRDKAVRLYQQAQELFTRYQMRELFTLDGEYLPALE